MTAATTLAAWHKGPMVGFDLETTGVDVEQDRVVTASLVHIVPTDSGPKTVKGTWLADPGIEIPEAATAVHGITTAQARAEGGPAAAVLGDVVGYLRDAITDGCPIVGMNLVYDFTLLDRDCRRHGVPPLDEIRRVVDVRVLDKQVSWRKGPRKLVDLCSHWGVKIERAHESASDALAALRLAYVLAERHPRHFQVDPDQLHANQVRWYAEQMRSFAAYRERAGQPLDDTDESWPIRPWKGTR